MSFALVLPFSCSALNQTWLNIARSNCPQDWKWILYEYIGYTAHNDMLLLLLGHVS